MKRKICVITATRAEYGLLSSLMKQISEDKNLELQIIATGMHLAPEFGSTYKEIEKDGFVIDKKIPTLSLDDSSVAISKSMALTQAGFAEAFEELQPDIIVILGDRYEMFAVAATAMIARIPIAHLHGGEATEGLIDESIRHAITKMSHLHFAATKEYQKRIIQLGEQPERVFDVGALGVENIKNLKLLDKSEFEKSINFKLNKKNLLVTFHPVTLEKNSAQAQFAQLLAAFDELTDTNLILTLPNSDHDGRVIIKMINDYVAKNKNAIAFDSLGKLRYLSAISHVDVVVGNSSSGIIEVPSFQKPTINIGDRQRGRVGADSIINCEPQKEEILSAIKLAYSHNFQESLKSVKNPYDKAGTALQIKEIIKNFNLENILKKKFYNIL